MSSWEGSACYPRSTFLSFERRPFHATAGSLCPGFPPCSACLPPSQAPLCHCTHRPVTDRPEATFEASVTLLEATTPVKLSTARTLRPPAYPTHRVPRRSARAAVRFTGLFVPSRVIGIFTDTTISPGSRSTVSDHYTIRAGRNLPDKEFRYLRTVIVTAAVRGFSSRLLQKG